MFSKTSSEEAITLKKRTISTKRAKYSKNDKINKIVWIVNRSTLKINSRSLEGQFSIRTITRNNNNLEAVSNQKEIRVTSQKSRVIRKKEKVIHWKKGIIINSWR